MSTPINQQFGHGKGCARCEELEAERRRHMIGADSEEICYEFTYGKPMPRKYPQKWRVAPLREDNPVLFKIVDEDREQVVPFTWEEPSEPKIFVDAHNKSIGLDS